MDKRGQSWPLRFILLQRHYQHHRLLCYPSYTAYVMAQKFFGPGFNAEEEWRRLDGRVADEDPMWGPAQREMGK